MKFFLNDNRYMIKFL